MPIGKIENTDNIYFISWILWCGAENDLSCCLYALEDWSQFVCITFYKVILLKASWNDEERGNSKTRFTLSYPLFLHWNEETLSWNVIISLIHPFVHLLIHPLIHPFTQPSIHPFIQSSINPFIQLFLHQALRIAPHSGKKIS